MRVAIVGYGILGMFAADLLDDPAIELHIFDLDFQKSGHTFFQEPLGPKSLRHPLSSPKGSPGNLDLWGQAISCYIQNPSRWPANFVNRLEDYCRVLSRYGFSKLKLQTSRGRDDFLKISYARTTKFRNKILFSEKKSKTFRHETLVHSIFEKENVVTVKTSNQSKEFEIHTFDYVLVCAGPVRSFDLISTSGLIPKYQTVAMFDHPTVWLGEIHTRNPILVHSRFRNREISYGTKPGAVLTSLDDGTVITIRIRPINILNLKSLRVSLKGQFLKRMWLFTLRNLGIIVCNSFSVAISLDYKSHEILAHLSDLGSVQEFMYLSKVRIVTAEVIEQVENAIFRVLGIFSKSWFRDSIFEETAAAHYSSLLGILTDATNRSVLEDFHLRQFPRISVPGSVSFPESVVGHPTYLALCTVVFEVERIKSLLQLKLGK